MQDGHNNNINEKIIKISRQHLGEALSTLMTAVENRADTVAKAEVTVQFGKAVERQVLLIHQQPYFKAYSVNRVHSMMQESSSIVACTRT